MRSLTAKRQHPFTVPLNLFEALLHGDSVDFQETVLFVTGLKAEQPPYLSPRQSTRTDDFQCESFQRSSFNRPGILAEIPGNLFGNIEIDLHCPAFCLIITS